MLIKIARCCDVKEINKLEFVLFDNVTRLGVSKVRTQKWKDLNWCDYYYLDRQFSDNDQVKFISIVFNQNNGEEKSLVFDQKAYICNDEGKTIEKIVCNY